MKCAENIGTNGISVRHLNIYGNEIMSLKVDQDHTLFWFIYLFICLFVHFNLIHLFVYSFHTDINGTSNVLFVSLFVHLFVCSLSWFVCMVCSLLLLFFSFFLSLFFYLFICLFTSSFISRYPQLFVEYSFFIII